MKKIISLMLIGIFMQSCKSQEKDLANITFTEKYDTFFGDIPNKLDKGYSIVDPMSFNSYKSESEKILYFDGIYLSGYRDKKGDFGTNNIRFEFAKKDNTLNYYLVTLYTKEKVSKLIEAMNRKAGKPIYISMLRSNIENKIPDALLWEDNTSYYSVINANQNIIFFKVFNKENLKLRKSIISGHFQYYDDYLYHLEKNNLQKNVFSYKNFVDYKTKEGNDFYIDHYRKP